MGRVARQPLRSAAQRARERLDGPVFYGSSRSTSPSAVLLWDWRLPRLFRGREKCAAAPGLPGLYRSGKKQDRPRSVGAERRALKGACRTMTPQTALAKHQRCGMDRPVMKTKSHAGTPCDDAEGPVLLPGAGGGPHF